jgi:hypothetical protein
VLLIYIAEAHAADTWPINSSRYDGPANTVHTPSSLEERRALAHRMLDALPCLRELPILIDALDDRFLSTYAAWPIRLYAVSTDGRLAGISQPCGSMIDITPFRRWLADTTT